MAQRIALTLLGLVLFSGFTSPRFSEKSRAVYRFAAHHDADVRTLDGGLFSLAIGLKRSAEPASSSRRERARGFVASLERLLERAETSGVDISIAQVHVDTRELLVNVSVDDAARLDEVRARLVSMLARDSRVQFVSPPGKVAVDE